MIAAEVYRTSNGQLTRRFLLRLNSFGPWGQIAAQLFKAQKASKRAKKYGPYAGINGSSFRDLSYQRKGQALKDLCDLLDQQQQGQILIPSWGWGKDGIGNSARSGLGMPAWVLYVDIPGGQVSFHSHERYAGPDYPHRWDGIRGASEERILRFCDFLILERMPMGADPKC